MRLSIMQKSSFPVGLNEIACRIFRQQTQYQPVIEILRQLDGRIFSSIKGAHGGEHNIIQIICRAFLIPTQQCLYKTGEPAASALRTIDDGWIRIFADSDIFR